MKKIEDIAGITVVKKTEIKEVRPWVPALHMFVLVLCGFLSVLFDYIVKIDIVALIAGMLGLVWFFGFPAAVFNSQNPVWKRTTGHYRYIVKIDNSVSITDIDGYSVAKNDDETYTLEEKK